MTEQERIGNAIIELKQATGWSASKCADYVMKYGESNAKHLFGQNENGHGSLS